jgi:PAS domain S-box-containing protein
MRCEDLDTEGGGLSTDDYRTVFDSVNDAIFVHDAESGAIRDVNEVACEMYGYDRETLLTLDVEALSSGESPYTQANAVERVRRAAAGEPQVFEWHARDGDDHLFWVEVSMRRAEMERGNRVLVIVRDIDDRKRARRREELLNSLLRHDIANDLQIAQGRLRELSDYSLPADAADAVTAATDAVEDGVTLIEKVRTLRRADREQTASAVSLDDALRAAIEREQGCASASGIDIRYERTDCEVVGGALLEELFANLIENAVEHSGGTVVDIAVTESEDACEVVVRDDGDGVDEVAVNDVLRRGTRGADGGLGLALVTEIARTYGGSVTVGESDLGGASFTVRLQRA